MEVHHHPKVEKKNFKEYFLEFIMIFLAVTLGFIAENIREDLSNNAKEKEYMKSMVSDLVSDTTMLNDAVEFSSRIGSGLDSLCNVLYTFNGTDSSASKIYRLHARYSRIIGVSFDESTSIQLRNSDGLRLIKNAAVRTAVVNYWRGEDVINGIVERTNTPSDLEASYSIFNRSYERFTGLEDGTGMSVVSIDSNARLMTSDKNQLITYANREKAIVSRINIFLITNLKKQKKKAAALIDLIKTEYHLKDE